MKGYITTATLAFLFFIMSCTNNEKAGAKNDDGGNKTATTEKKKTIVFFGNSLTAGYGLSPTEAFPALIQNKIDS